MAYTVSEYNHPFPNEYGCEMPLLLAAYASLQGWDAIEQGDERESFTMEEVRRTLD